MRHSPGPWTIYDCGADYNFRVETNGKGSVCKVARKGVDSREVEEANAQLIAAAPDLLNAAHDAHQFVVGLASYLAICNTDVIVGNLETTIAALHEQENQLQAAICKAEGETA